MKRPFLLVAVVCALLCALACHRASTIAPPPPPVPGSAFPQQIGQLKLEGPPSWDDILHRYQGHYRTPDGKRINYEVRTGDKQTLPNVGADDKPNVLFQSDNLLIRFSPVSDELVLNAVAGADDVFAEVPTVEAVNDLANNLPYAAMGGAKPAQTVNVQLPPPSADQSRKATSKKDDDINKQVNSSMATIVETWFLTKRVEANAYISAIDPSTLRVKPKKEIADVSAVDKLADSFKSEMGKQLKGAGFRQFTIGARTYQF